MDVASEDKTSLVSVLSLCLGAYGGGGCRGAYDNAFEPSPAVEARNGMETAQTAW